MLRRVKKKERKKKCKKKKEKRKRKILKKCYRMENLQDSIEDKTKMKMAPSSLT